MSGYPIPPEWALKEDGSLGDTTVAKLGMAQEHFARLASERYEKILELQRRELELSGEIARLSSENKTLLDLLIDSQEYIGGTWRKRRDAAINAALAEKETK